MCARPDTNKQVRSGLYLVVGGRQPPYPFFRPLHPWLCTASPCTAAAAATLTIFYSLICRMCFFARSVLAVVVVVCGLNCWCWLVAIFMFGGGLYTFAEDKLWPCRFGGWGRGGLAPTAALCARYRLLSGRRGHAELAEVVRARSRRMVYWSPCVCVCACFRSTRHTSNTRPRGLSMLHFRNIAPRDNP